MRPSAGGFESRKRVEPCEPAQSQTSAIAVLGVRALMEQVGNNGQRLWSNLLGPLQKPPRRPFQVLTVTLG